MHKFVSLFFSLVAASSFGVGGGSSLCFAAEVATPMAVAVPEVTTVESSAHKTHHPSQRTMHKKQQASGLSENTPRTNCCSQRKMHKMQLAGSGANHSDSATEPVQERPAPNPSQRSMRQKMRAATPNQSPTTDNSDSR